MVQILDPRGGLQTFPFSFRRKALTDDNFATILRWKAHVVVGYWPLDTRNLNFWRLNLKVLLKTGNFEKSFHCLTLRFEWKTSVSGNDSVVVVDSTGDQICYLSQPDAHTIGSNKHPMFVGLVTWHPIERVCKGSKIKIHGDVFAQLSYSRFGCDPRIWFTNRQYHMLAASCRTREPSTKLEVRLSYLRLYSKERVTQILSQFNHNPDIGIAFRLLFDSASLTLSQVRNLYVIMAELQLQQPIQQNCTRVVRIAYLYRRKKFSCVHLDNKPFDSFVLFHSRRVGLFDNFQLTSFWIERNSQSELNIVSAACLRRISYRF